MDVKETVKKFWWVGAILIALLVVLRSRRQGTTTVSRLAAVEAAAPTSDGILQQTLTRLAGEEAARASRIGAAQEALALQQIDTQRSLLGAESAFQMSILQGQTLVQNRLADKASKVKFQCPPGQGVAKINPETGQLFCRPKAGGGGFKGLLETVTGLASSVAPFFGSPSLPDLGGLRKPPVPRHSTPPFVPGGF